MTATLPRNITINGKPSIPFDTPARVRCTCGHPLTVGDGIQETNRYACPECGRVGVGMEMTTRRKTETVCVGG